MKLVPTTRKIRPLYRLNSTALLAALLIASCGGRARDQREPEEPSASAGGADSTVPAGGASSGGASSGGQSEGDGGTDNGGAGSSQSAGGSFGGAFESSDFDGSCRYAVTDGSFWCAELYGPGNCGLPTYDTTQERTEEPCPREGLIGVCIDGARIHYHYENSGFSLKLFEESCSFSGTFVRP